MEPGQIVILNGVPRSGKSSIAHVLVEAHGWVNHGVDTSTAATPAELQPGIGLRPGGERPDLEPDVARLYAELWERVSRLAEAARVVVDVGLHRDYATELDPWAIARDGLAGRPVLLVGVRCTPEAILERRAASTGYLTATGVGEIPDPLRRWEAAVHGPGHYDMEVDTSIMSPADAAAAILQRLDSGRPGRALWLT